MMVMMPDMAVMIMAMPMISAMAIMCMVVIVMIKRIQWLLLGLSESNPP